jgi:hypothetical protein
LDTHSGSLLPGRRGRCCPTTALIMLVMISESTASDHDCP